MTNALSDASRCPFSGSPHAEPSAQVFRDGRTGCYVVSRYVDAAYVMKNTALFSSETAPVARHSRLSQLFLRAGSPVVAEVYRRYKQEGFAPVLTLAFNDSPSHAVFRAALDDAFAVVPADEVRAMLVRLCDVIIDAFDGARGVEFVANFAVQFPLRLNAILLGLPEEDWQRHRYWSSVIVEQTSPRLTPERELEIADIVIGMQRYLHEHLMRHRKSPGRNVLSGIANAMIGDKPLADEEMIDIVVELIVAGSETMTGALTSSVFILATKPEIRSRVVADPSLIAAFVEETLRLHPPIREVYRRALVDTQIGGIPIPQGAILMISYDRANRDASVFECREEFTLEHKNVRRHMAFSKGVHFCPGHRMARMELTVALECLLRRKPNFHLDASKPAPTWTRTHQADILESLHLEF
jgi:cytochrome P450